MSGALLAVISRLDRSSWSGLRPVAGAIVFGALLVRARRHIGPLLRSLDRGLGLFAPRGAALSALTAPHVLAPLYRRVAQDISVAATSTAQSGPTRIVELGSGPGDLAVAIAHASPGIEVVGVDLAPAMIAAAEERAERAGVAERVAFVQADGAALPYPEDLFDLAVSTLSLHHWTDPGRVFAEIARVQRPGGVAYIFDPALFAYRDDKLDCFLSGTGFDSDREREVVKIGPVAAFVRWRLVKLPQAEGADGRS